MFYLIKEKGVVDAGAAALRVSGLELGGLLGSRVAGRISDWYIATSEGGAVGKRILCSIAAQRDERKLMAIRHAVCKYCAFSLGFKVTLGDLHTVPVAKRP